MPTDYFWAQKPVLNNIIISGNEYRDGERLFNYQMDALANGIILNDYLADSVFYNNKVIFTPRFTFLNRGEVIAGSSVCRLVNPYIEANDVDIYVRSVEDAIALLSVNNSKLDKYHPPLDVSKHKVCYTVVSLGTKINLIWGIKYKDAEDLISRFDIRACSMALDPNSSTFTVLSGAVEDSINNMIHFNLSPRSVSVARLLKYISKGFTLDKYQRVVFAELIRNGYHSNELELTTGYGGNL